MERILAKRLQGGSRMRAYGRPRDSSAIDGLSSARAGRQEDCNVGLTRPEGAKAWSPGRAAPGTARHDRIFRSPEGGNSAPGPRGCAPGLHAFAPSGQTLQSSWSAARDDCRVPDDPCAAGSLLPAAQDGPGNGSGQPRPCAAANRDPGPAPAAQRPPGFDSPRAWDMAVRYESKTRTLAQVALFSSMNLRWRGAS